MKQKHDEYKKISHTKDFVCACGSLATIILKSNSRKIKICSNGHIHRQFLGEVYDD